MVNLVNNEACSYCVRDDHVISLQPISLPLDPKIMMTGIIPAESSIFKSSLNPLRLTIRTEGSGKCQIIVKKGDDLRQDQLVGFF